MAGSSAFVAAGGYFYWHAEKLANDYPTATTDATKMYDQMKLQQIYSGIAFGLGAACLTTSGVFAIKQHKADKRLHVSLLVLPNIGLLGLSLNF